MVFLEPTDGADALAVEFLWMRVVFLAGDGDGEFFVLGWINPEIFGDARVPVALEIFFVVYELRIPGEDFGEVAVVARPIVVGAIGFIFGEQEVELLAFHSTELAEV